MVFKVFLLTLNLKIMKNLSLEHYGVSQFKSDEIKTTHGGSLLAGLFIGIIVGMLIFDR